MTFFNQPTKAGRGLKRLPLFAALCGLVIAATGCGAMGFKAPVVPPRGVIFSDFKAPLDLNAGPQGTEVPVENVRVGTAEQTFIFIPLGSLPLSISYGEAGYKDAAANGSLNRVAFADYEYFNVLGIYMRTRVHAYGD